MTRPAVPRLLACLLAAAAPAIGTVVLTPSAGTAAAPTVAPAAGHTLHAVATPTPLEVSITTLTPSTIPQRGRVTLTGLVSNDSKQTWTDLNVYMLTSPTPLRSRAELSRAAATDQDAQVGARRAQDGLYERVGDLGPGQSVPYRLSVPRADLGISGEQGVYWVGVHVLGAQEGVRDAVADGRARTFMPLLPAPGTAAAARVRTSLALVVPVRKPVHRGGAARLLAVPGWDRALAADGRLTRLLRLSGRARQPFTWVVDPAVLDAVQSVAQDNPKLDTGPTGEGPAGGSSSSSPSPGPESSANTSPTPSPDADGGTEPPSAAAAHARAWLEEFRRQAPTHEVTTVPYGDLDVAAVLDSPLGSLYQRATTLSASTMSGYGIDDARPVLDPVGGYLPETALRQVSSGTTVLLDESAVPGAPGPVASEGEAPPVVLTDTQAGQGGPMPSSRYSALAVRQRLLSDAALHAFSAQRDQPLVVAMPAYWDPGDAWASSGFFAGLDRPWLQMVDLRSVAATSSPDPQADRRRGTLVYPRSASATEVPLSNLEATDALLRTGSVFASVLSANDTVDDVIARVALLGSSVSSRADPDLARRQTNSVTHYVRSQMSKVHIEGPPFVMMSGESGPIQVTLVNDLPQTVTVGLSMSTPGSELRIAKRPAVTLGAGRRMSIRLQASADDIGVHAVTLRVTDADGEPIGSETNFSVRTSHVSTVIWVIIGIGGGLLLVAIVIRLFRRIRRRKATHGPLLRTARHDRTAPGPPAQSPPSDRTAPDVTDRDRDDLPGEELKA